MALSSLLRNRLFRIPQYQRAYSWQTKHRRDMFDDIAALASKPDSLHFMATVVGLRRGLKTIVTDEYRVIDIVDGQQRITTLIILLKAIEKQIQKSQQVPAKLGEELQDLLVKQDDISLILLQTNHDKSQYFVNYIRHGTRVDPSEAATLADAAVLRAIKDCEQFVEEWLDPVDLLRIIKNQLHFIFHEIADEYVVYTVFEVLNNRGLNVSWLDRFKSMLMSVAFEHSQGNATEHIGELHQIWGTIYEVIGLRQGMSGETLRFAATLKSTKKPSKPLGEEAAVASLIEQCGELPANAIGLSKWVLDISKAVDRFLEDETRSSAVTKIAHSRLLAVAIVLRGFSRDAERRLLDQWERVSFRIFGLCSKDARTSVGAYTRLAWDVLNNAQLDETAIANTLTGISEGKEHTIDWAVECVTNNNCYEGWEQELRYLLMRYEEHLAKQQGQKFENEQWQRIWKASAAKSIEHIQPQSKGSSSQVDAGSREIFVHRLGNLVLLPPGLNSTLQDRDPIAKCSNYTETGLHCATEVAETIRREGWGPDQVEERENRMITWIRQQWA